jgi:hypothetical protein
VYLWYRYRYGKFLNVDGLEGMKDVGCRKEEVKLAKRQRQNKDRREPGQAVPALIQCPARARHHPSSLPHMRADGAADGP